MNPDPLDALLAKVDTAWTRWQSGHDGTIESTNAHAAASIDLENAAKPLADAVRARDARITELADELRIANVRGDAWRDTVKEDTVTIERLQARNEELAMKLAATEALLPDLRPLIAAYDARVAEFTQERSDHDISLRVAFQAERELAQSRARITELERERDDNAEGRNYWHEEHDDARARMDAALAILEGPSHLRQAEEARAALVGVPTPAEDAKNDA